MRFLGTVSILMTLGWMNPGGEDLSDLIQAALDQPVQLDVTDTPIRQALTHIAEQTGVRLEIADPVIALLPYGEQTKVTARMSDLPLREGLIQLTQPLALHAEVRSRWIEIVPDAVVLRMGRRLTWDELDSLALLRESDFDGDPAHLERLRPKLQFRVGQADGWPQLQAAIRRVGAGRGDEVLDIACGSLGWTWCPEDKAIIVMPLAEQVARQLQRHVCVRQSHRNLMEVLRSVADQVHVDLRCEPGALRALPATTRDNFSLFVENKTAREAFELVAATSGLGYRVEPQGVVFYNPSDSSVPPAEAGAPAPPPSRSADPFVGKIVLPAGPDGTTVELVIRESDLTPEVNALRRKHIERANDAIREALERMDAD